MAETEPGVQNSEDFSIVLVDRNGQLLGVSPSQQEGALDKFISLRQVLIAGVDAKLFETNPFIVEQSAANIQISEPERRDQPKPVKIPQYYPALSEEGELERQRVEAADRIAGPLGIDRNKFLAKLPGRFPDRGPKYDEYALYIPLISVDTTPFGINWYQMTEAALYYDPDNPEVTLKPYINPDLQNLEIWKDPRRIESFPQAPHSVWVQDGTRYREVNGLTPRTIRGQLQVVERASDHWKGTSLTVLRPDMVKGKPWDLIGGHLKGRRFGPVSLPSVCWRAEPLFFYDPDGFADPRFRALVSGSEYIAA